MCDIQLSLWDAAYSDVKIKNLAGHKIAITGKLRLPRAEAIKQLEAVGGIYASSVTKNTDFLVTGDLSRRKVSRKLRTAWKMQSEERKISLMTPCEFFMSLGLIGDGG